MPVRFGRYAIESRGGSYLRDQGGTLGCYPGCHHPVSHHPEDGDSHNGLHPNQHWILIDAGDGQFCVRSHRGKNLEDRNGVLGLYSDFGDYQKWNITNADRVPACNGVCCRAPRMLGWCQNAVSFSPTAVGCSQSRLHEAVLLVGLRGDLAQPPDLLATLLEGKPGFRGWQTCHILNNEGRRALEQSRHRCLDPPVPDLFLLANSPPPPLPSLCW